MFFKGTANKIAVPFLMNSVPHNFLNRSGELVIGYTNVSGTTFTEKYLL